MRFGVLGQLAVWDDRNEPVHVPEAKVRALLADLLVHEGRPVPADRLIDDLWGDAPPGNPANALQAKVSQLRRALGRDRVAHEAAGYRLRLDAPADVDAERFRALVERARDVPDPAARAALLTEALELWRGPAFADFADAGFARAAADRLDEQRLAVLEERAEARLAAGDHVLLVGELTDLVARHPLRERLRAAHMRALYLAGRQSEALDSYAGLRARLAEELGVDPGPELAALHQAILRQDPSLAPPATGPQAPPLPAPLTPLIGRDLTLAEVERLLDGARLVTLTGPGGVGKTRLAVEAAHRLSPGSPDGVWLVELAGLGVGDDVARAVAAVLGVRDDAPDAAPLAERLAAALRDRRPLLVLDNCEHVVRSAAALADRLLRAVPGLRILATGREPLDVAGETVLPVEPLPTADAVRLFTERARASAPGVALDADAVTEICERLDGIPLALELAATRVRGLGVRELAARLENRFRVLTSGRRGAPERQQTLRAVIDWSWELLSAPERIVLRRLSVHRDGCTLEAAEAVCAGDGVAPEEVLDLVTRLVDRSLVVMVDGAAGPRYRLLESVAAYAGERLREMEDHHAARHRHLRYHLDLAERAEPRLRGAGQREWLGRLDAEAANLRAALGEAIARRGPEAPRLVKALCWWWLLRGRLAEGRAHLASALRDCPPDPEVRELYRAFRLLTGDPPAADEDATAMPASAGAESARAAWLHAFGLFHAGALAASEDLVARVLDACDDEWTTAAALGLRAMHALVRGDLGAVERDGRRSAGMFRALGDRWGELQSVTPLASLAEIRGDYAEAERLQREGLSIARELDLAAEVSARTSGLGRLALLAHDWDRARDLHERALRQAAEQGYVYGELHALMGLALGARRSGDLAAAERHLTRIRDEHTSSEIGEHLLAAEFGFLAEMRGNAAEAAEHHRRGLKIARSVAEPRAVALSLEGLAGAAVLAGEPERAALLLGAADAARRSVGAPLPPGERLDVDRITAAATRVLGAAAFAAAFREGGYWSAGSWPPPGTTTPDS
ncbi:BTAD domain-containing putative transcriptional regulator [Actinomadura kijaniata]|uniref:BTAD domain-containing putative transcriptional regulator n=1 Tax=Actinomadura kijaniata TaxID=46161 RepID=UPI00082BF1A9|nr:BTAD domain-containing putative transcriptional regulator [Actinomadura kijaniata]